MRRIIVELLKTKKNIFARKHLSDKQKKDLWQTYYRIRFWRFSHEKLKLHKKKTVSFLGYKVHIDTVGSFYGSFKEIFINEDYGFEKISSDSVIIDAGANIGLATIYFSWRFPEKTIHAYEAHPETFQLLKENISSNHLDCVHIHQKALCDHNGVVTMTGGLRAATVDTDMYTYEQDSDQSFKVAATTLTSECRDITAGCFVLKMDIEGSEYAVLKELAGSGELKKFTAIRFEFHSIPEEQGRLQDLLDLLEQNDFIAKRVSYGRDDHFIIEAVG